MKTEVPTVCEEPWRENKSFQLLAIKTDKKSLPESTKIIREGNRLLSPTVLRGMGGGGTAMKQFSGLTFCVQSQENLRGNHFQNQ